MVRSPTFGGDGWDGDGSGSGYVRDAADTSPADVARVEALLAERTALRRERRYDEADAVRDELNTMGVNVWDRDRIWSMDDAPPTMDREANGYLRANSRASENNFYRSSQRAGSRAGRYEDANRNSEARYDYDPYSRDARPRTKSRARDLNEFGHDYSRADDDTTAGATNNAQWEGINELLRDRLEAKLARDFDEADALLAQLYDQFGVTVNDGAKLWRADGQSFERRFRRIGPENTDTDEEAVLGLIKERMALRKERNYKGADEILSELLEVHGVVVVDSDYTWRYVGTGHDGSYAEGGAYGRRSGQSLGGGQHDYLREPGDEAPIEDAMLEKIDDLLARRLAFKKARQFEDADGLQNQLWDECSVGVDDKAKTWWVE